MNVSTCEDYKCEGAEEHNHTGVQSHLRRVIYHGKLVDGKTGKPPVEEKKQP